MQQAPSVVVAALKRSNNNMYNVLVREHCTTKGQKHARASRDCVSSVILGLS